MIKAMRNSVLLLLLFVVSCAAVGEREVLYERFKEYARLVAAKEYDAIVESSISADNRTEFRKGTGSFGEQFPVLAALPETLSKRMGQHERIINGKKGCLTINGLDESGGPTSLHIEYVREEGIWRLNYAEIAYLESEKEFSRTGKCPVKPE